MFVPTMPPIGSATLIPQLLLYSFLLGFLINRSLLRKQTILSCSSLEISRLRRLRHLVEFIHDKRWATHVRVSLQRYERAMVYSVLPSEKHQQLFRDVSHLIYQFVPKTNHETQLYHDLLETTRELALEHQRYRSAISNQLSWYGWFVISTNAFFVIAVLLANRDMSNFSPIGVTAAIASICMTYEFLIRTSQLSKTEQQLLQAEYQKNIDEQEPLRSTRKKHLTRKSNV